MHKFIFHSDTLGPVLAGMICICCLLSGCRMQARTEMFPSKEGYLVTIGEDPTDTPGGQNTCTSISRSVQTTMKW